MRSPSSLGLGSQEPFVRPSDIVGAYIVLLGARFRDGTYGPEVIFRARLLEDAFDTDGNALPLIFQFSQSAQGASEARLAYVDAFRESSEEIGPFAVIQLPATSDAVDGAIVLNDATGLVELPAAPAPKAVNGATRAMARAGSASNGRSTGPRPGPSEAAPRTYRHSTPAAPGTRARSQRYGEWYVKSDVPEEWVRADAWEMRQQSQADASDDLEALPF